MAEKQEEYTEHLALAAKIRKEDLAAKQKEAEILEARHKESMAHARTQRDAANERDKRKEVKMKRSNELSKGCLFPMSDNAHIFYKC